MKYLFVSCLRWARLRPSPLKSRGPSPKNSSLGYTPLNFYLQGIRSFNLWDMMITALGSAYGKSIRLITMLTTTYLFIFNTQFYVVV